MRNAIEIKMWNSTEEFEAVYKKHGDEICYVCELETKVCVCGNVHWDVVADKVAQVRKITTELGIKFNWLSWE